MKTSLHPGEMPPGLGTVSRAGSNALGRMRSGPPIDLSFNATTKPGSIWMFDVADVSFDIGTVRLLLAAC
jgi:hypothetical protein